MHKSLRPLAIAVLVLSVFAACKKDEDRLVLQPGKFQTATALTASATSVTLSSATENDSVLKFTWQPADFAKVPVITYTLQMDSPADTANNWANAKSYPVGANTLQYGFIVKVLNDIVNGIYTPGSTNDLVFRIKADVDQNNGAASTVPPVYSNTVSVSVTTYGLSLYAPGDYQNWTPSTAPLFPPINGLPGKFEGFINFVGAGIHYFKFTNAPDWDHTNYGDGGGGSFSTDGAAGGLSVPDQGYYEVTADLNTNKWTATKTTWGIIGDAAIDWNTDAQMTYDATAQVWTITMNMRQNGSFKFRANGQWSIDFGIDGNGKLQYADNPFFPYNGSLSNLSVPEDGNYTITLDLHMPSQYTYILHKN